MQDIFREYGLFVMVSLVSATVWVVIAHILSWGGSNTALYANEDDSEALQNQFNMTDIQEPRFVNFYIPDSNGKNTANLRNVIGYNSPGKHKATGEDNWRCRAYGKLEYKNGVLVANWGFPYNTVYGYTAFAACGGYDSVFNVTGTGGSQQISRLGITDYLVGGVAPNGKYNFTLTDDEGISLNKIALKNNTRGTVNLSDLYQCYNKATSDYEFNIHVYRIFTDEERSTISKKYSAVTTNQVYSTNLLERLDDKEGNIGAFYTDSNLDITKDNLYIINTGNTADKDKIATTIYTKPKDTTLKEEDAYDVSYEYTDDTKSSVVGKTTVSVQNLGGSNTDCNAWVLTVKTNDTIDFTWTRDSSSGVAVITDGSNELTDYDISTKLSKYMWNLADTIRIKFFLSTATNSNLADYNNTLSKMIEAGDETADINNKAVYLINTTFKYKLVYQYKNNITGMKAEQAYTITVDSNNG